MKKMWKRFCGNLRMSVRMIIWYIRRVCNEMIVVHVLYKVRSSIFWTWSRKKKLPNQIIIYFSFAWCVDPQTVKNERGVETFLWKSTHECISTRFIFSQTYRLPVQIIFCLLIGIRINFLVSRFMFRATLRYKG